MTKGTTFMKKLALSMAAVLALLSIAGCAQYVGKAKPRRRSLPKAKQASARHYW